MFSLLRERCKSVLREQISDGKSSAITDGGYKT
jgi:hypothetical protein